MQKKYLIGADLGTSSTKAAVYDLHGRMLGEDAVEVALIYPAPGQVEQESEDFYRSAAQTVQTSLQRSGIDPREVAALAFDSQMAGIGSIDDDFRPAAPFDSWLDMRCQPMIEWMEREALERVIELTGCPPTCDHGPKMLWRKHERPAEYDRVVKFVTPAGYVAGRIAGLKADQAFMDETFIHFSGFSDSRQSAWSQELCSKFGLDLEKLPRIIAPWTAVGEVTQKAAGDFGLAPGTLVAAGCGDTAACALGAGVVRPGMLFDIAGTAADRFVADKHCRTLLNMHSVIPGLYHPLAYIAGGGLALRWFRDQFFKIADGAEPESSLNPYARMDAAAAKIPPGAEGLFFSPHLGGRICPSAPEMRGVWAGFSWGHTSAHFYRAILESVAFEYAWYLRILSQEVEGLRLLETRAAGGGARSRVWNQIKADVLGVPYRQLAREELGAWGAAMIAGKAAGVFEDLASTAENAAGLVGQAVAPDVARHDFYAGLAERFSAFQETQAGYFKV
jgi:xylulokinase